MPARHITDTQTEIETPAKRSRHGICCRTGVLLLAVALVCQNTTLASQRYEGVLVAALVLEVLADCCFIEAFRRGRVLTRCASVALLLPTLFIVADFARRAATMFR
jgi:hypothetical protein